jgi:hypothetical protein
MKNHQISLFFCCTIIYIKMHILHVSLEKRKLNRLLNGHTVQLTNKQLHGHTKIVVDTDTWKKYIRSTKNGTGARISLGEQYIAESKNLMQGEGFKQVLNVVKNGIRKGSHAGLNAAKRGVKRHVIPAAAKFAKRHAANAIKHTEMEVEDLLIRAGMPQDLVKEIVTTGSHTLSPLAMHEIDELENRLTNSNILREQDYDVIHGGRFNFKKFFRRVGKAFKPVAKALKPLARPLLKRAASSLITAATTAIGAPELAPALNQIASSGINSAGNAHGFGFKPLKQLRFATRPTMKVARSLGAGVRKRKGTKKPKRKTINGSGKKRTTRKHKTVKGKGSKKGSKIGSSNMKARMAKVRAAKRNSGRGLRTAGAY